jgi:hypothetical protein
MVAIDQSIVCFAQHFTKTIAGFCEAPVRRIFWPYGVENYLRIDCLVYRFPVFPGEAFQIFPRL